MNLIKPLSQIAKSACLLFCILQVSYGDGLSGRNVWTLPPPKIAPISIDELRQRLKNVQLFAPSNHYRYQLSLWSNDKRIATGSLEGVVNPQNYRVNLIFDTGAQKILLNANKVSLSDIVTRKGDQPEQKLSMTDWLTPFTEGSAACVFNTLLPILDWENLKLEGSLRKKGRPAYRVCLFPSEDMKVLLPNLAFVEVILDAYFDALLQVEVYDKNNKVLAAMRVLNFKKVDKENWIVKDFELECGNIKNRLVVEDWVNIEEIKNKDVTP